VSQGGVPKWPTLLCADRIPPREMRGRMSTRSVLALRKQRLHVRCDFLFLLIVKLTTRCTRKAHIDPLDKSVPPDQNGGWPGVQVQRCRILYVDPTRDTTFQGSSFLSLKNEKPTCQIKLWRWVRKLFG